MTPRANGSPPRSIAAWSLGLETNKAFLSAVLRDPTFAAEGATTDFLERRAPSIARSRRMPPPRDCDRAGCRQRAQTDGYGEWTAWSNTPARVMRARLACGHPGTPRDVVFTFEDGVYRVAVDGDAVQLRLLELGDQHARLELNGEHETAVAFAAQGDTLHLACEGASFRFDDVLHAPPLRQASGAADGRLIAPMNGRVVAIHATIDAAVEAGATVVVLEAMKMEHGLTLGAAARVTAVHVATGARRSRLANCCWNSTPHEPRPSRAHPRARAVSRQRTPLRRARACTERDNLGRGR